jgi:hypothetical protein
LGMKKLASPMSCFPSALGWPGGSGIVGLKPAHAPEGRATASDHTEPKRAILPVQLPGPGRSSQCRYRQWGGARHCRKRKTVRCAVGGPAPYDPITRASSHAPPQRAPFAARRRKRESQPWCQFMSWAPPVPGVGVVAKGPQGWVQWREDHLPSLLQRKTAPAACQDDSTTPRLAEDLGGGTRGPGVARVGLLGLQCSARQGAVPDSFVQNKMTRIASLD